MRLFQFADDSTASRDITSFMAQVRGMEVQADSLAHIGPVEDAVTLTTPAGAAGRHWECVDTGGPARRVAEPRRAQHHVRW